MSLGEPEQVKVISATSELPAANNGKFIRGLGLLDSTMLVAGSMIGSGIFIVSSIIARQVGSPGWLLVVWLVTGLLTLTAALSYGELAAMMPKAGGQYVYLREAFSPLWGFLYGWTLFLVIQTGTIAAVAVGFARYTGVLIPWVAESNYLIAPIRFGGYALSLSTAQLVGLATGTGSTTSGFPAGVNRRSAAPPHIATQTQPSASTVRPSGKPSAYRRSANTRRLNASPVAGS